MGNMRLPVRTDVEGNPIDREKAQEIIDYAMANGINYYDTAYMYHGGESEKFLGEAMSKYNRSDYYLATKYIVYAGDDYEAVFNEQLSRLKTDYIDFYLIHALGDDNADRYLSNGSVDYFLEQQKKGRIKYFGFSSHASPECLERFASHHQWDFAQIQLNYFDWCYGNTEKEYGILSGKNIPIVVMEPVRGGRLANLSPDADTILKTFVPDRTPARWAFEFVKSLPGVQLVLSGMSSLEQIKENIATFSEDTSLSEKDKEVLFKSCRVFKKELTIPCTACRYCCDGCPAKINIPAVLEVYNRYRFDGDWALQDLKKIQSQGKASDCISCGACTMHCPQGIDIPAVMKELAEKTKD